MKLTKLNISKTTWSVLAIGIFVVSLASLGMAYGVQQGEQSQLNEELLQAQLRLKRLHLEELAAERQELEEQLSQAISQLEKTKVMLSQPVESADTNDAVLNIADEHDVEVIEIISSGLAGDNKGQISSFVLPLTLRVEGDINDLIGFISALQNHFTASAVKSVEIRFPEPSSEEKPLANIQLTIHTYEVN